MSLYQGVFGHGMTMLYVLSKRKEALIYKEYKYNSFIFIHVKIHIKCSCFLSRGFMI